MHVVVQEILLSLVDNGSLATHQHPCFSLMPMTNFQTALEAMAVMETDNREVLWHGKVRFERSAGKTDRNAIDLPKFLH